MGSLGRLSREGGEDSDGPISGIDSLADSLAIYQPSHRPTSPSPLGVSFEHQKQESPHWTKESKYFISSQHATVGAAESAWALEAEETWV